MQVSLKSIPVIEKAKVFNFDHQDISEGIGLDYIYKWTPGTPVFISAQTGSGKNTFVENVIIRRAVEMHYNVLILSNRIALSRQEKQHIAILMDKMAPKQKRYESYTKDVQKRSKSPEWLDELENFGAVTIKSYQGFLARHKNLAEHYDFIILDECHFFLADAKFNKYTHNILKTILRDYPYSTRIYMTATLDEVINPILTEENNLDNLPSYIDIQRRNTPAFLNRLDPRGGFYWDEEYNQYTLIDYNVKDQCKARDSQMKNGGRHDTYDTYNNHSAVIYNFRRNYSYINCKYLRAYKEKSKKYQSLIDLIKTQISGGNREKWLVFVSNRKDGQNLLEAIGEGSADYINANSKEGAAYLSICNSGNFDKKVLITTSVIDNGINIDDPAVKHVAIFAFDKVSFVQMLGRRRINKDEKITLYLQEQKKNSLTSRLENLRDSLARIKRDKSDHKETVNNVFENDSIFFYTGKEYPIAYNKFLEEKLRIDIVFLDKLIEGSSIETQSEYSFEESTIIEQLSWIGIEDSFDRNNYLKELSADDKIENGNAKNEFLAFLDRTVLKEEFPKNNRMNFFKEKGMNPQAILVFQNTFTELYKKAFGRRTKDKNNDAYKRKKITDCFKDQQLPYEIMRESVQLTPEDKSKYNTNKESTGFWILVAKNTKI